MTPSPFEDPAEQVNLDYNALNGSLLMIHVTAFEPHVPTVHTNPGEKNPAVRGVLTVLDGPQAGQTYEDALIFPKFLVGQLRNRVGKLVLGRLGQGPATAGKSPPWKLATATPEDRQRAEQVLARVASPSSANQSTAQTSPEPPF